MDGYKFPVKVIPNSDEYRDGWDRIFGDTDEEPVDPQDEDVQ